MIFFICTSQPKQWEIWGLTKSQSMMQNCLPTVVPTVTEQPDKCVLSHHLMAKNIWSYCGPHNNTLDQTCVYSWPWWLEPKLIIILNNIILTILKSSFKWEHCKVWSNIWRAKDKICDYYLFLCTWLWWRLINCSNIFSSWITGHWCCFVNLTEFSSNSLWASVNHKK